MLYAAFMNIKFVHHCASGYNPSVLLTIFDVCKSLKECTLTIMPMHTDVQQNVQMNMATLNSNY